MTDTRVFSHSYGSREMSHDPEYIWQDDAACAFMDPLLFEPILSGSSRAEGLSDIVRLRLNTKNFKQAKEACASCPVLQQCKEDMTHDDRKWVFRAGLPPLRYSGRPVGRPGKKAKLVNTKQSLFDRRLEAAGGDHDLMECQRGHAGHYTLKNNGKWACAECRREDVRRLRARDAKVVA